MLTIVIPVFGVDSRPSTLICAHTSKASKQYLEGYELQFLRAIGVIILSAVLRRRMVLADKAKSILISSVSHELRTPLHGILAAAELLADTDLDQTQVAFLRTVQSAVTRSLRRSIMYSTLRNYRADLLDLAHHLNFPKSICRH
jgi:signal transduction histidine kinase